MVTKPGNPRVFKCLHIFFAASVVIYGGTAKADKFQLLNALAETWIHDCSNPASIAPESNPKKKEEECLRLKSKIHELGQQFKRDDSITAPCSQEELEKAAKAIYGALGTVEGYSVTEISKMVLCIEKNLTTWKKTCETQKSGPPQDLTGKNSKCEIAKSTDSTLRPEPIKVFRGQDCEQILIALPESKKGMGAEKEYHHVFEHKTWTARALGKHHSGGGVKPAEKAAIQAVMNFPSNRKEGLINTLYFNDHDILQEYFPDGDLSDWMEKINPKTGKTNAVTMREENNWAQLGQGITIGLENMHSQGWSHGDIKPKNVLVSNGASKTNSKTVLSDFGSSANRLQDCLSDDPKIRLRKQPPTLMYMAPELGNPFDPATKKSECEKEAQKVLKADIFSTGLTLFSLRYGEELLPWKKCASYRITHCIETQITQFRENLQKGIAPFKGDQLDKLLAKTIDLAPENRPTAEALRSSYDEFLRSRLSVEK